MTGSGNDFVMLDGRHSPPERWPAEPDHGGLRPAERDRRRRPGDPDARRARPGPDGLLELATARGRPCAATPRSAAPGSPSTSSMAVPGSLCLLTDAGRSGPVRRGGRPGRDPPARHAAAGAGAGLEPGRRRRALARLRDGRGAAPRGPGGRHRARRRDGPGAGAPVRSAAGPAGANVNFVGPAAARRRRG